MSEEILSKFDIMRNAGVPESAIKAVAMRAGKKTRAIRNEQLNTYTPATEANYSKGVQQYNLLPASDPNFGDESELIQSIFKKNKDGGYQHQVSSARAQKVEDIKYETRGIDPALVKKQIETNPKFKGATVSPSGIITLPDGKKFDSSNMDDVKKFEKIMANRSKDPKVVRKDIALGNLDIPVYSVSGSSSNVSGKGFRIDTDAFNNDARLKALGYKLSRDGQVLMKDGKRVDLGRHVWANDMDNMSSDPDKYFTRNNATMVVDGKKVFKKDLDGYVRYDMNIDNIMGFIYDNTTEEELTKLESINTLNKANYLKKREEYAKQAGSIYTNQEIEKSYKESDRYMDRMIDDMKDFGVKEENIGLIENFITSGEVKDGKYWNEMKDGLSPEEFIGVQKALLKRKQENTYKKGFEAHKKDMESKYVSNMMTAYLDDEVEDSMRGSLDAGLETQELLVEKTREKLDIDISNLETGAEEKIKEINTTLNATIDRAKELKVGIDVVNGQYVAVGGDDTDRNVIKKELDLINYYQKKAETDFEEVQDKIVSDHGKYNMMQLQLSEATDLTSREYGNLNLLTTKFSDRVSQMALSIPALAGSSWAVDKKAEIQERQQETLRLVPSYDEAIASGQKFEYMLANAGDQAPNMLAAIGLTVATGGSALASPIFFGLDSAASSWVDTDVAVKSAAIAKKRLAQLELNRDNMDYDDYKEAKIGLQKQILNGDLSQTQRYGAAFSSGLIEFGVQYGLASVSLGTSGWANKFVNGPVGQEAGEQLFLSNFGAARSFAYQTVRDQFGELVEEISIEGFTNISNGLILGREISFDGLDDVAVSTLATGGMMMGGNVYTAAASQYATKEVRQNAQGALDRVEALHDRLAALPTTAKYKTERAGIEQRIKQEFSTFGDINSEMEIALMIGGASNLKNLAKNAYTLRQLNSEAGVKPGDTEAQKEEAINKHLASLEGKEKDLFKSRLDDARERRAELTDVDFEGASVNDLYGRRGVLLENKLKEQKGWPSKKKDQLIKIHQALQKQAVDSKVKQFKKTDAKKGGIYQAVVNQTVYGDANYTGKRDMKKENLVWEGMGKQGLIAQDKATTFYNTQTKLGDTILNEKELANVTITYAKDRQELEDAIINDPVMSDVEKEKNLQRFKDGELNGLISNGQFITIDEKGVKATLDVDGKLTAETVINQGTVISHEISHAIDALAFTESELADFSEKLERDVSSRYSAVDKLAKRRGMLEEWYNPDLPHSEQTQEGKDEYAKAVQEIFMQEILPNETIKLKKERQSLSNKIRGKFDGDFVIKRNQDATFFVADFIDKFNQGKISESAKRRIKARKDVIKTEDGINQRASARIKRVKGSQLQTRLQSFKSRNQIEGDIVKGSNDSKKLVAELLQGGEIDPQKSILGQEAGGIIESITKRLYDNIPETELNGVTRKEYKDQLLSDLAVMISNEYSEVTVNKKGVETRNSLDKFASNRLNARAGTVAQNMGIESSVDFGGLGFKVDLDKANNVIDNYTPTGVFGEVDDESDKKIISLRRKLKIEKGSDLYNKVLDKVVLATVDAGDINTDGFKKKLQDAFADALVNDIKKILGTPKSPKYKTFLQDQGPAVYSKMSLATLNQRFQYFTEAVVDEGGKQKRMNVEKSEMAMNVKSKTAGNAEFIKKSPTKQVLEDWVNYFVNPQSVTPGVGRSDSRRTSLAEAISVELGFDAMMEVLEDPATLNRVKQLAEIRGFEISDNFLSVLGKVIDRAPGTKFSSRSKQGVDNLQSFLRDSENRVLEGVDINPVLDDYVSKLSPEEKKEMLPIINKIKDIYKEQGKDITMEELRASIGEQAATIGEKLGFEFFDNFDKMLETVTKGKVKRLDTTTTTGFEEYQRRTGEFSGYLDPDFLNLGMLTTTFTGAASLKTPRTRTNDKGVTKVDGFKEGDVKPFYKPNNNRKGEFKGDLKQVAPITTALEEKILDKIKNLKDPKNPTPAELKALSNEIEKDLTPEKRKALEQARDYFYNQLNEYVNEDGISATERAGRLAYVSTLLQTQTSASGGLSRQGAVVSSVTLDYSETQVRARTGKPRPYQSEHNLQLLNFNGNVLKAIANKNFATAYPIISKRYTQTLLDADAQSVLDSKTGELSKEFIEKYGVRNLSEYIGKTAGAPDFIIGMDSEAMFVVALGNANRTLDLRTGLTMDQVIYNKINANKSLDYLDGIANNINEKIGNSKASSRVKQSKDAIFNDANNSNLWNSIITKSVLGVDPKSDVFMLAQRIDNKETYDQVKRANNRVLLEYGLAAKQELKGLTEVEKIDRLKTFDNAAKMSRRSGINPRGMSTFDFDETAGISDNFVIATKEGETKKISSAEWPMVGDQLLRDGWKMDFSDFNKVTNGRPGPLMQKLKNQIAKYGPDNVFILTARAPESAQAIKAYLESEGVNLPLKNITGLGNSTGEAKAMWMLEKFAEGYNDMYFVDDALPNVKAVKNVLDQLDIKSKVVQTRFSGRSTLDQEFNEILEETKGIKAEKRYSRALAKTKGANIGKMQFFLPPSAEDFEGLIYPLLARGKKGDRQKAWFNKHLFQPFARANRDINAAKQKVTNDYRALKKQNPDARKKLKQRIPGSSFTYDHAVRVYLWNKAGFDIPGLSAADTKALLAAIEADASIKSFADQLGVISQQEAGYTEPSANWVVETVASDLNNITQSVGRKQYLAEWIQNKNEIFSEENLNKLEAIYGSRWREAMEDMLYRMENGTNRNFGGGSRLVNQYSNWVNNSVGAIMFFNGRSAVLQTLSTVNFINWSDNNPLKAAAAFANQPQYWSDFVTIFNSDMLRQRRAGLKTDVNQAELAQALAGQKNKAKAALNYLLKIGFTPTQIADSFAISAGGATFYRNRIKTYLKQGLTKAEAETKAFEDFQEIAEKNTAVIKSRFNIAATSFTAR